LPRSRAEPRDPRSTRIKASLRTTLVGAAALVGAALWWRRHPSACPYSQRFWVEAPHPFITRDRLREALGEVSGARVLEVGPGTGYYSIPVAEWIGPAGSLEIFDLQREMLDHTLRRAEARGLTNVTATHGDARTLPYDDASFDAAYLITVLGEIPDQHVALAELRRVLKPAGRLVVGELWGDPHVVPIGRLRQRAAAAGLSFERRVGPRIGFFAAFAATGDQAQTNPR
jgi:ubiquinone/menaquinone biosynthesis C-methylase UbiE